MSTRRRPHISSAGDDPIGFIAAFPGKTGAEVEWVTKLDTLEKAEAELAIAKLG